MLEGAFKHEDFCGHKGTINPGDLQVHVLSVFKFDKSEMGFEYSFPYQLPSCCFFH